MKNDLEKFYKFREQKFIVIPNFFNEEEIKYVYDNWKKHRFKTKYKDRQVDNCISRHNYPPVAYFSCEKIQRIVDVAGVRVLPTYSYIRTYFNKSELKKHRDRDACEISVSVHLNGDKPWNLIIDGSPINLNPGDGVAYWGREWVHWREPYDGEEYTNVFLHYVMLEGHFIKHMFDTEVLHNPA